MDGSPNDEDWPGVLSALSNPHRMRIVARLSEGRDYVSRLAREVGISRPLLHMHLQRLEAAGLIVGTLELGRDGKAVKYFDLSPFDLVLDPRLVAGAVDVTEAAGVSDSEKEKNR